MVFSPRSLISLLFRPRAYFSNPHLLNDRFGLLLAAMITGMVNHIDSISRSYHPIEPDIELARQARLAVFSWPTYWLTVVGMGVLWAVLLWYLQGWWYRMRLQWSGAGQVAPEAARAVNMLQNLVYALPTLCLTLIQTALYQDYAEAWLYSYMAEMLLMALLVYSFWTSYCAATSAFTTCTKKALFWFLLLPTAASLTLIFLETP